MEEWERRWSEVGPAAYLLWDTMRVFEQREQEYLRRVAWYGLGVGAANPWPRYHWHEYWLELRIDLKLTFRHTLRCAFKSASRLAQCPS